MQAFRRFGPLTERARAAEAALPLEDDQVEARRLVVADDRRQQRMRLPAMVRLVIEEMVERGLKLLLDCLRIDESAEAERAGELSIAKRSNVSRYAVVFRAPRRAQGSEIVVKDRIE